jgi:hypothetical protein
VELVNRKLCCIDLVAQEVGLSFELEMVVIFELRNPLYFVEQVNHRLCCIDLAVLGVDPI